MERQKTLPVRYGHILVDAGYRIDLLVDDLVIIEVKSVRQVVPIHRAQLLTYLKLSRRHLGLLLNFNVEHLKLGISRLVNNGRDPSKWVDPETRSASQLTGEVVTPMAGRLSSVQRRGAMSDGSGGFSP